MLFIYSSQREKEPSCERGVEHIILAFQNWLNFEHVPHTIVYDLPATLSLHNVDGILPQKTHRKHPFPILGEKITFFEK